MDLTFLDRSSDVTPLLVRLYDTHKLYDLAKDKKPLARMELTGAVSELLGMALSEREKSLIADVMIELVRQAETDLRQALAQKLAVIDDVPLRLILEIANDDIEIARPILQHSDVLGDLDLTYIIKSKDAQYWQAIAARKALSDQVMETLADTRDFDTALVLAQNSYIKLSENTALSLSDLAQQKRSETLAAPLLHRTEVTSDVANMLYNYVGQELKSYIRKNYEVKNSILIEAVDDLVFEFGEEAKNRSEFTPTAAMTKAAMRYKDKGLLSVSLMVSTLRRGQIRAFIAQFAGLTGMDTETVETVLSQSNGQGLAVACRAFDVSKQDFMSIFLLTNRVRNHGRMVDLKEMTRAVGYYNRIKPDVAKGIMAQDAAQ